MASTTSEQTDKNNDQVKLDLNQVGKTDTPSHNEDQSDTNTKTNEETKQVETTTTVTSTNSKSNANDEKNKQKDNTFPIEKGDQEHLTDFQRQKAKYFFNVNLDIENKEYVTWDDVEFYLLFHITAAGKEGSDGGDLENRLSRAARAFWEHVHDQVPLDDGKRDKLTLVQFLDTWESLIDYVVRTNQLPGVVQELVNLGFELYSTTSEDEKIPTIQPQAFDQLFQKMNIGRPYALLAYKYLTDNGTKPLDADRIESLVKAVITSSDDENDSHFLLPGFFKTLSSTDKNNKSSSSSPVQEEQQSTKEEKTTSTTESDKPSSPLPPQPNKSTPQPQEQQKGSSPTSPTQEKKQSSSINQNGVNKPSTTNNQQRNVPQQAPPPPPPPQIKQPQKPSIQQEDDSIRNILRFYHIDDGDLVEVAGGSVPRLVLVHPERPLPPYIQQNKELLQKIQPDVSVQQNGFNNNYNTNGTSSQETKPKVTLEERVSRGEAQKGPTTPVNQSQKQDNSSFANVRQVYPPLSEIQQEEQRKQAKLQATQSNNQQQKQRKEESSTDNDATLSSKPTKDINPDDEEKIIAAVLKQLAPIVEQRVAAEVRRLQSADTDEDEDDNMIPFPFMFGGGFPIFAGPPPSSQAAREQRSKQNTSGQEQQQSANEPRLQAGPTFIPPQLLMAMMNDLARGGMAGGDIPVFSPNMPPPPHGPAGVEGFMMFVDDDQFMGGPPPSRPPPTF